VIITLQFSGSEDSCSWLCRFICCLVEQARFIILRGRKGKRRERKGHFVVQVMKTQIESSPETA
jgi:hypothetical protein